MFGFKTRANLSERLTPVKLTLRFENDEYYNYMKRTIESSKVMKPDVNNYEKKLSMNDNITHDFNQNQNNISSCMMPNSMNDVDVKEDYHKLVLDETKTQTENAPHDARKGLAREAQCVFGQLGQRCGGRGTGCAGRSRRTENPGGQAATAKTATTATASAEAPAADQGGWFSGLTAAAG